MRIMDDAHDYQRLLERALEGEASALDDLVAAITPVVHVRVARALCRRREAARGRSLRADLEDLTQDVFAALFAHNGKALRAWEPERGLGFLSFVGFLAEREVAMRFRSAKRNPWTEDPTQDVHLAAGPDHRRDLTRELEARDLLSRVLDDLLAWLTPEGRTYFEWLFVQELPIVEVAARARTTPGALYAWRSRLLKRARMIRDEVLGETHGEG